MTYEFQSNLFCSSRHMCEAVAIEWMTGGGWQEIDFSNTTPEREADDCIAAWGLDSEWMKARGIDRSDILTAFEGIA